MSEPIYCDGAPDLGISLEEGPDVPVAFRTLVGKASDKSTRLFRKLFDSNLVPMARVNIKGDFLEVNQVTSRLLGYNRKELETISWLDLCTPETLDANLHAIELIKQGKPVPVFENEFFTKNGGRLPFLVSVTAEDKRGNNNLCLCIDLTDRKRTQEALQSSEKEFRMLLDTIPQIVFLCDTKVKVQYYNKKFYEITGIEPGTDPSDVWQTIIHADDLPGLLKQWQRVVETGENLEAEVRQFRASDGAYTWGLVRAIPLKDRCGQIFRWIGTVTDINEKKQAESELRQSEERFRTLTDAIPHIVWTASAQGDIDFFNHRWLEYTGLSIEQSLSGAWKLLIHPDDLPAYLREWETALHTGNSYQHEFRLKRAIGFKNVSPSSYRWHLCKASALKNNRGQILKWFATWTEIENHKS